MRQLISLVIIAFLTYSCGVECAESTGRKFKVDLSKAPLSGDFKGTYGNMKINFPNDTTAPQSNTYQFNAVEELFQGPNKTFDSIAVINIKGYEFVR